MIRTVVSSSAGYFLDREIWEFLVAQRVPSIRIGSVHFPQPIFKDSNFVFHVKKMFFFKETVVKMEVFIPKYPTKTVADLRQA